VNALCFVLSAYPHPMKLLRPIAVAAALLTLPCTTASAAETRTPSRPNIILMMADDLGWGDPGFNGNPIIKTPHLDAMAKAGLRFDRFYSGAPVCSPTRGSCLTGRHPYRYGIWTANEGHLRKEEVSLPEVLKAQGYTTGHYGKWHLGTLNPTFSGKGAGRDAARNFMTPAMKGSDDWFATEYGVRLWDPFTDAAANPYYTNGKLETENLAGDDSRVLMDRAIPFIRKAAAAKTPFLAVIWFHAPHEPVVAGPEYLKMYPGCSEGEQHYYGCITALDEQVGRLRKELRDLGVADNTMVWFTSDNGPEGNTGDAGRQRGSAGGLRGRKRSLWEGGVRVPGLLEWPARIKPGTVTNVPCSTLDYFPTTLDLLGFRLKGQPEPIDGVSLVPLFEGRMTERPVPIPFETIGGTGSNNSRGSPRMALVDNRYKLLTDMEGAGDKDLLFDLLADPSETKNLAAERADVAQAMKAQLAAFRESCKRSFAGQDYATPFALEPGALSPSDPGFKRGVRAAAEPAQKTAPTKPAARPNRRAKAGAPNEAPAPAAAVPGKIAPQNDDSGIVTLTAAAATTHGDLAYRADQNKIGRWSSVQDWLTWEFEIRRPGRFTVEANIGHTEDGSVYEVIVDDQVIRSTVSASGSHQKQKAQVAGALNFSAPGRYTLALKPVSKQGPVVMSLWSVSLIPTVK
jgi:arylsulfatase A-like enzyme